MLALRGELSSFQVIGGDTLLVEVQITSGMNTDAVIWPINLKE